MNDPFSELEKRREWLENLPDGVPCDHVGCLSHISHPCETCGRVGGKRIAPRAATLSGLYNCGCCGQEKCTEPGICDDCLAPPTEFELNPHNELPDSSPLEHDPDDILCTCPECWSRYHEKKI